MAGTPPARGLHDVRRHLHLGDTWPPRGRGLPVGAHTSQFLAAHVVLGDLDSRLLRTLRVGDYVRYVDDLFLFGRRKDLDRWRLDIEWWLQVERGLRLKHADAPVLPTAGPLDALGHRITRGGAVALPEAMRRLRTALRQSGDGPVDGGRLRASMASRVDWALPK